MSSPFGRVGACSDSGSHNLDCNPVDRTDGSGGPDMTVRCWEAGCTGVCVPHCHHVFGGVPSDPKRSEKSG